MKKLLLTSALSLSFYAMPLAAIAAESDVELKHVEWEFDGMLGKVDKVSAQRGFQVYKEVCSACHGLKRIAFRNLQEIGFSEAEVKALAAEYSVQDGPNDEGDMFDRPGLASDYFPSPYANEEQARSVNNGANPPDLSLIIKSREHGPDYLYSLLTGYGDVPDHLTMPEGMHYNKYFPGYQIAMPPPLFADLVSYEDETPATVEQMSKDIVSFLQWTAEPEMEDRKRMGLKVLLYLLVFTGFMYVAKKRIWSKLDH